MRTMLLLLLDKKCVCRYTALRCCVMISAAAAAPGGCVRSRQCVDETPSLSLFLFLFYSFAAIVSYPRVFISILRYCCWCCIVLYKCTVGVLRALNDVGGGGGGVWSCICNMVYWGKMAAALFTPSTSENVREQRRVCGKKLWWSLPLRNCASLLLLMLAECRQQVRKSFV